MNTDILINSAALFFETPREPLVSRALVDEIVALSESLSAQPLLFTASGEEFTLDDCYSYSDEPDEVELWDTPIPNRKRQLQTALQRNAVSSVWFDVPLANASRRSEWSFNFSMQPEFGEAYWGVASTKEDTPNQLAAQASQAIELTNRYFNVRYGFAYSMPLRDEPAAYATGSPRANFADIRQWLATRSARRPAMLTADECWQRELTGPKRHLTGLFRDAYHVNLLSSAHVERADLLSTGIGLFTKIAEDCWLWQVEAEQLDAARAQLVKTQALVEQHAI